MSIRDSVWTQNTRTHAELVRGRYGLICGDSATVVQCGKRGAGFGVINGAWCM